MCYILRMSYGLNIKFTSSPEYENMGWIRLLFTWCHMQYLLTQLENWNKGFCACCYLCGQIFKFLWMHSLASDPHFFQKRTLQFSFVFVELKKKFTNSKGVCVEHSLQLNLKICSSFQISNKATKIWIISISLNIYKTILRNNI